MDEDNNSVPEFNVASMDGGSEKLNADPITQSTSDQIDSMLDMAEAETSAHDASRDIAPAAADNSSDISGAYSRDTAPQQPQQQQPAQQNYGTQQAQLDPEILAIEQPRNLSEKNQSNWRKLQETASTYKRQAAEAEILRQRLEQQQTSQQVPQDYEELRKFRQIFDIKNDPEFRTKYDAPISSAKENIYNIMRKNGAPDDVIASIEAAGGPDKVDQNWWKKNAIDKLPMLDGEILKKNLVDVVGLKQQQDKEVEHAAQNAEQFLQERQDKSKNWYAEETNHIENHISKIVENVPWARFQQIPQGASQEQVQRLQEHNKNVWQLKQKFDSALWPTTPQDRANVAAAATFSHVLTQQLRVEQKLRADLESQLKRAVSENNSYKGAAKVPRPGVGTGNSKASSTADRIKMSASDAIDLGLDEAGE